MLNHDCCQLVPSNKSYKTIQYNLKEILQDLDSTEIHVVSKELVTDYVPLWSLVGLKKKKKKHVNAVTWSPQFLYK